MQGEISAVSSFTLFRSYVAQCLSNISTLSLTGNNPHSQGFKLFSLRRDVD